MRNRRVPVAGALALVIALAGCSGGDEEEPFPLDTMPEQTATPEPTPTEEPTEEAGRAELPRECGDVVEYRAVVDAVAVPLSGGVTPVFIDGGFHEASGRLQRLTCSYGLDPDLDADGEDQGDDGDAAPQPPPILEIALSSYVDAQHAEDRLAETVAGGSGTEPLEVAGTAGYVLSSDESVTFVAAEGPVTYVVSLTRGFVPENAEQVVLITLAEELLGGGDAAGSNGDD